LKKKCQSDLQTLWDQHSIEKAAKWSVYKHYGTHAALKQLQNDPLQTLRDPRSIEKSCKVTYIQTLRDSRSIRKSCKMTYIQTLRDSRSIEKKPCKITYIQTLRDPRSIEKSGKVIYIQTLRGQNRSHCRYLCQDCVGIKNTIIYKTIPHACTCTDITLHTLFSTGAVIIHLYGVLLRLIN
jgi:hypothetical protein